MNFDKSTKLLLSFVITVFFMIASTPFLLANGITGTSLSSQIMTVMQDNLTNENLTVVGDPPLFNSGITYDVTTVDELKSKLNEAVSNCQDSITLNYTGSTAIPNYPTCLSTMINDVLQTAGNDYEKNILSKWSYSYTLLASPGFKVTYSFTYLETADQRLAVTNKVNDILGTIIRTDMSEEQKEKAINDYIVLNVAYDTSLVQHSAYAALFGDQKTVCQGYALLAYKMLTTAGFEARIITGTVSGTHHAWNLIKYTGNWYHLDCTWNDPIPDVAGNVRYDFFNLQDSEIKAKGHVWDAAKYPSAITPYVATDPNIIQGKN